MRFIFLFSVVALAMSAQAARVDLKVPASYLLLCSPAEPPVTLLVHQSLDNAYDCTEAHGTANYKPVAGQLDVELGVNHFIGELQPFIDEGKCRSELDYANIYLRNDVSRYIAGLHANGDATVSRFGNALCTSGPHAPGTPAPLL